VPYKSRAQQRKFHAMAKEGELPETTVQEFDEESKGMELPERVSEKETTIEKYDRERGTCPKCGEDRDECRKKCGHPGASCTC
jgi:hypothetical protein